MQILSTGTWSRGTFFEAKLSRSVATLHKLSEKWSKNWIKFKEIESITHLAIISLLLKEWIIASQKHLQKMILGLDKQSSDGKKPKKYETTS